MKITEKSYINRFAILCHVITAVVLFAAYTIEFFNGSRTLSYYAIFSGACLAPVIAEVIIYKVNKESGLVKHIMSICYGGLYVFAVLTSTSSMAYTYAFPMYMAIILYMDIRCCALIATGGLAANVIYVVRYAMNTGYSAAELPDVEIRIAAMVLTGVFMILTCAAVRKVNKFKLEQIQEQSDETSKMSGKVLAATDKMTEYIQETSEKIEKLGESVHHIHDSMSQVSTGSNETAEAVQTQMERTEQIQEHIVKVRDAVERIEKNITDTSGKVDEGRHHMAVLSEQVDKSMDANNRVLEKMKVLTEYTNKMNTIIETITSIANSTGMLALNASIEAARAGEAGRGFSVVATEISGLASQTKDATVNITELIKNINTEFNSVKSAIEVVTESNKVNAENTRIVTDSFGSISTGADDVELKTKELREIVKNLETANADIVENIQTISAITEEVSAHAGETCEACEGNIALVSDVEKIVNSLNGEADNLNSIKR
ncbi:putative methyl-accepting chemotaxis protein [Eshraghiella crossota CAG:259]|uniref:Putative methyl-accepting chemotaxis protein n=1 Tax=Eshraghiella crossota CAG:259 TaxID=1263062 RepID=R5LJP3_9FIRM|nr:putative methyl-accepting chemotaxis protein [Butyrivibrio crossotus CAG:259]